MRREAEEGTERAGVERAGVGEKGRKQEAGRREGRGELGRQAGQARKGRKEKAELDPRAGLKRKKERFFKFKFFFNSSLQF